MSVDLTVQERILEAGYACVARYGLAKTTVEDAAREGRVSRATVYRYFPGGRDQLIGDAVTWEAARFFARLSVAIAQAPDFPSLLEEALGLWRSVFIFHVYAGNRQSSRGQRGIRSISNASRLRRTDAFSGVGQPDANAHQSFAAKVAAGFELRNS